MHHTHIHENMTHVWYEVHGVCVPNNMIPSDIESSTAKVASGYDRVQFEM